MTSQPIPAVPRPTVGAPPTWSFPEPDRSTVGNGCELVTYQVPGQYVVSARVVVPLPLDGEPADAEGVGTIMARTLDEGTAQHSASEMAALLERTGAQLSASVGEAGLVVDVEVPVTRLQPALELLEQCLAEPVFPEREVHRQVMTRLAEIEQDRSAPARRAVRELVRTIYHPADRASRPAGGTPETVETLDHDSVARYHGRMAATGSTIILAGDLPGGVDRLVESTLGRWSGAREPGPRVPGPAQFAAERNRIVVVDRPGAVQAELVVAAPGPDRRTPDWPAYPVLGFVMGGSPLARIDAVLREEKGYTYGIRSGFRPRRQGGLFLTSGSVRADVTVPALSDLLDILDGGRDGFTEQETQRGVDFVARTAPGRYATADTLADEAASMALDALTTQFTTTTLRAVEALTAEDLTQAYRAVVDGSWTVVVVADAGSVADELSALGRGDVTVVPA